MKNTENNPSRQGHPADPLIGPFLQNPGTGRMTVAWIRRGDAKCVLSYGSDGTGQVRLTVSPKHAVQGGDDHFYEAVLTGLMPGTEYAYSLSCPGGEAAATFKTFPVNPDHLAFICYGDNKGGVDVHRRVVSLFEQHSPAFIMHSGDMTDHGRYEEYGPLFFSPLRQVIDHVPLFVGRGNHEGDGKAYRQVFSLPENETWYSFDYGHVHCVVLDTTGWRHEWEKDDIQRMQEWLDRDLAGSTAAWKIVMHHEPSYDLGWRKDDWGLKDFLPLMRRRGVDMTFSGHAHGYQRLHPMKARGENETHPVTHIISAGAGASLGTQVLDESKFLSADARQYNYVVLNVSGGRLRVRVFSDDDVPLDEFALSKSGGEYDQSFIDEALWAEEYP